MSQVSEAKDQTPTAKMSRWLPAAAGKCRLTFEIGERRILWTGIPMKARTNARIYSGEIEAGYAHPEAMTQWFREFWSHAVEQHRIYVFVSGQEILQRVFTVPVVPRRELPAVVTNRARRIFPFDVSAGLFDWRIIAQTQQAEAPQYTIHAEALGGHWEELLKACFEHRISDIACVTAASLQLEYVLDSLFDGFDQSNSFLVRLRGDVLETAFFHDGRIAFFREAAVDGLDASMDLSSPQTDVREVSEEMRRIIRDALDYYLGQASRRQLKTTYLCLPCVLAETAADFVSAELDTETVDLVTPTVVQRHASLAGVASSQVEYPLWLTLIPLTRTPQRQVNLLPEDVIVGRERRAARAITWVAAIAVLLSLAVYSLFERAAEKSLAASLDQHLQYLATLQSDQILQRIEDESRRADVLIEGLLPLRRNDDPGYRYVLQLFSQIERPSIQLESLRIEATDGGGNAVEAAGIVLGNNSRQEPELYSYLLELKSVPGVGEVNLGNKYETVQFGRKTVHFSLFVEVKR